jgi:hypothetical protein
VAPIARRSSSTFGARTAIKKKKKIQSAIGRRCYKFLQCMSLQCRAIFFFVMKAKKKEKKNARLKTFFFRNPLIVRDVQAIHSHTLESRVKYIT